MNQPPYRIQDVDAVRGFALLGIFIVNITFMASAYPGNLVTDPAHDGPIDQLVHGLSTVFVDMKFYVLFSFLFGYSFTLQLRAAQRAGADFHARMYRRIAGLFALGVAHIVLLYGGDILTTYALACLMLLWLHRREDRSLLKIAAWIYGITLMPLLLSGIFLDRNTFLPSEQEALATAAEQTRAMLGGYGDIVGHNLDGLPLLLIQAVTLQGPTALAMFLLGMVAGRRELLARVRGDEPILRRIQWIGFPVGLTGSLAYTLLGGNGHSLAVAASVATAPLLTAAYVATLLRIMHNPRTACVRTALAPAGRIALTNYLGQSLIALILFTGIGFGLAGRLSPLAVAMTAFAIFAAQLVASALWLRAFRYGPAEWILRWITNGHLPALRAPAERTAA